MSVEALAGPEERLPADKQAEGPAPVHGLPAPGHAGGDPILVRMTDQGIIKVTLPPNQMIEEPQGRVAGAAVRSLAHGRRLPVLLVMTGVVGVSAEVRHLYVNSVAPSAVALLGESPVDRVIAHYLLRWKTETTPAQFFTSEPDAVAWLRQHTREG